MCRTPRWPKTWYRKLFLRLCQAMATNPTQVFHAGWLYTVARRLAIDAYRTRQREAPQALHYPPSPDPATAIAQTEAVEAILDALPDLDREILLLFYYQKWSIAEIAHHYGIRAGAVRTRLMRARQRFRALWVQGLKEES
jgi:RNA polymerase sigma factor (sigma-70 family)